MVGLESTAFCGTAAQQMTRSRTNACFTLERNSRPGAAETNVLPMRCSCYSRCSDMEDSAGDEARHRCAESWFRSQDHA